MEQLRREEEIRCLILRGAGDKAFSSGFDISAISTNLSPEMAEALRAKNPFQTALQAIIDFPYPVIAMIKGPALGAGCELAVACDLRIAAEDSRFGIPPAKLGLVYSWSGIMRLINVIGVGYTKEIFFTGRTFDAARAREIGLVNYVLPVDQLDSFTYAMAEEISENAPLSLAGMKTIFRKCEESQKLDPQDALEIEALRQQALNSEDSKEAQRAFKEKRKPVFHGR
jgi:enoyl-CoA hydratase/carnithine racemase